MKEKKFEYYINNKRVGKTTFYNNLKNHSQTVARTSKVGDFTVHVYDFDKKKYRNYCRKLNGYNGHAPVNLGFVDDLGNQLFSIRKNRF